LIAIARTETPAPTIATCGFGLVDVSRLFQIGMGDGLRGLAIDVHPGVQLAQDLERKALLNQLDRLLHVGSSLVDLRLAGHEDGVPGRERVLVVLECDDVLARLELCVGGEDDRQVRLALVEHFVAQADVDRCELLELQAVVLLQPDQAVGPLPALGRPVDGQVLRLALQV